MPESSRIGTAVSWILPKCPLITDDSELLSDNLPFLGGTVMFFVFLGLFALAYFAGETAWKVIIAVIALVVCFAFPPFAATVPIFYILRAVFRHFD